MHNLDKSSKKILTLRETIPHKRVRNALCIKGGECCLVLEIYPTNFVYILLVLFFWIKPLQWLQLFIRWVLDKNIIIWGLQISKSQWKLGLFIRFINHYLHTEVYKLLDNVVLPLILVALLNFEKAKSEFGRYLSLKRFGLKSRDKCTWRKILSWRWSGQEYALSNEDINSYKPDHFEMVKP